MRAPFELEATQSADLLQTGDAGLRWQGGNHAKEGNVHFFSSLFFFRLLHTASTAQVEKGI